MSKTETAKALFKHLGYLLGGMSLVIMTLFMLGYVMDELVQIFGLTTMPFLASLVPLVIMVTGTAWGGYFIWKGAPGVDIAFGLICKLADVIALNRMSRKAKVLIGEPAVFAGMIIMIVFMILTAIRVGINGAVLGILWPLALAGLGIFLFGLVVTHGIKPRHMEQKSYEKTKV